MTRYWGEIEADHEDQRITLRLDMGTLAAFESRTGQNALAFLEATERGEVKVGDMLAMVEAAAVRGGCDAATASDLANDLLSSDIGLFRRLMQSTAPQAVASGNETAQGGDAN